MECSEKMFLKLINIVKSLDWGIAIPTGGGKEDDGILHGMIIGEQAYIDYILKHLD